MTHSVCVVANPGPSAKTSPAGQTYDAALSALPLIRCHDDPTTFVPKETQRALAGLSLRVSPDAWRTVRARG
jgi:hypothetical protein